MKTIAMVSDNLWILRTFKRKLKIGKYGPDRAISTQSRAVSVRHIFGLETMAVAHIHQ